ncbi:stage V sporulation protein AD [Sinanaerobacter chloroacetimidivorans]|jgi:stage V sporulation protein AD|uniref:Stage V sporulation protein AD n=1 Tax=Sinanaerobacter chloroacetimidivorans TaxID=2818044 RepID=A0A8J7W352_9FIRM|nr:stage V sporulation protein AD [Sinanaerobacter chloroacetimidivorans]MBR0599511.1 stage V sporulation protein AD [Sinanaerobacter chloroacetimidivorans]
MKNKLGKQTLLFRQKPRIIGAYSIVGEKEGKGPMAQWFDTILDDDTYGEKTWEKSESKMLKQSLLIALQKSGKNKEDIDTVLSGDLINQLMSSSFMARDLALPFIGLYGACSTMAESLVLGSVLVDGGYAQNILAGASSHYCTAERQFRNPLEHGNQRPPSAQWTATASGAMVVSAKDKGDSVVAMGQEAKEIYVTHATIGKIIDTGIKDVNQMGAAMAPAAVDTIMRHFSDTGKKPDDYDIILTGDLGLIGKEIAVDLLKGANMDVTSVYDDCGAMLFDKNQDTHSGGSGCGCSAAIFAGYVYKQMRTGKIKNALLLSTGALLSTISPQQGESIPGIAHAVAVTTEGGGN